MKQKIRNELIARRKSIHQVLGTCEDLINCNTLPALLSIIPQHSVIAGYYSIKSEFNCTYLLSQLRLVHGFEVCLPVVVGPHELRFKLWDCDVSSLFPDKFGIPSLAPSPPFATPTVILVPFLGFNHEKHRIGYGGGFYDCTLANFPLALSIGLGFSEQLTEFLPIEPHDFKLNYVITEKGIFPYA